MSKTVDEYLAGLDAPHAALATSVRKLVLAAAPGCAESVKWAQPVYESDGPFAYFRAHARHVTLGFWRGADLDDPKDLLESAGSRMAHVKLPLGAELPAAAITRWVKQAVKLNRELGNPTKSAMAKAAKAKKR